MSIPPSAPGMPGRLAALRREAAAHDADVVFLSDPPDLRWAVGFTGSNGLLLVTSDGAHFVTDGRYASQAREEVSSARVHVKTPDLLETVVSEGLVAPQARVLFDGERVTVATLRGWQEGLPGREWVPGSGVTRELRGSKDEGEIEAIRRAQGVTEAVFDEILPHIAPGVTERDLAAEIVYQHLRRGASAMAFEPIVASGRRGALPHARPSDKAIARGELVVIDMGCVLEGYASDMTRTLAVGAPEEGMRRAYEAVLEAQVRAIGEVRSGASGRAVDAVARGVLLEAGLADYFSHGLGHGVGLEVHEWPRLSFQVDHALPANAVVTVEPGVYLPDRFGIRIEDLVVAREGGPEVLTRTPKELLVL